MATEDPVILVNVLEIHGATHRRCPAGTSAGRRYPQDRKRTTIPHELGSARMRRERYVGEWLPEPLPSHLLAAPADKHGEAVRAFKVAWERGDIDALIGLLDPDGLAIIDGGGLVSAALHPIEGADSIARFLPASWTASV
jgi:hypothetical protein